MSLVLQEKVLEMLPNGIILVEEADVLNHKPRTNPLNLTEIVGELTKASDALNMSLLYRCYRQL